MALQSIKNCVYFNRSSTISAQVVSFLNITRSKMSRRVPAACCHGRKSIVVPAQTCRTPLVTMGTDSDVFNHVMYLPSPYKR